jgi:hypothetical protein
MFADGSLKVSDHQKLRSVIEKIGWESYQTPDLYFQSGIAKARDAADTETGTRSRLKKINETWPVRISGSLPWNVLSNS